MRTGPSLDRRGFLHGTAATGLLAVAGPGSARAQSRPILFGSASLGSTGYVIIETLSAIVNKHSELRTSSMSTSGGSENLQLIGEGMIDFGQSSSPDWPAATAGRGKFGRPIEVHQMFSYTVWSTFPMVRADSDITSTTGLGGRRVSPSTAGGSTRTTWELMTGIIGNKDDIDWTYGSWRETYDAFRAGAIECVPGLLIGGRPAPLLQELQATMEVRGLGWPEDAIAQARETNPGIMRFAAEPELWSGVAEPTPGVGSAGILAAHPSVTAETAYTITKTIFDNAAEVRNVSMELKSIDLDFAVRYLMEDMPVNAGAAQYFKEQGVWRDELTIAG